MSLKRIKSQSHLRKAHAKKVCVEIKIQHQNIGLVEAFVSAIISSVR